MTDTLLLAHTLNLLEFEGQMTEMSALPGINKCTP